MKGKTGTGLMDPKERTEISVISSIHHTVKWGWCWRWFPGFRFAYWFECSPISFVNTLSQCKTENVTQQLWLEHANGLTSQIWIRSTTRWQQPYFRKMINSTVISLPTLEELNTLKYKCNNISSSLRVSVPSAVSSMLERLCPRLMPLTAGGRSTLDPLSWGVEDVTSGGTLFSGGEEKVTLNENNSQKSVYVFILVLFIS